MAQSNAPARPGPRRATAPSETPRLGWSTDTMGANLRGAARIVLWVLSIAVLSAALPAYLIADVQEAPRSDAWIVTLLIMIWAGIRLSFIWVNGTPRLFEFFFWLFVYIFMGLAPTAQIRSGLTSTTTPGVDPSLDMATAGVVALGIVCFELGRLVWVWRERTRAERKGPAGPVTVTPDIVRGVSSWRTILLYAVALALSAYVLVRLGPTALLGSREAAGAAREAAWPDPAVRALVYPSGIYPLLVAVGALAQLARRASSATSRRIALGAAVFGGAVLVLIVNPVSSARYTFGTVAFALVIYAGAAATRRAARLTMLAGICGFLFLFPIADAFRRTEVRVTRSGFFDEYLSNGDYDAFWQIANALSYWLEGHVVPFSQFLGSVLFWVPRSIWPDKPTDTGVMLAEYRGYAFKNLSAPMWAEGVVNGGIAGVIIVFLLLGIALRAMDTRIVPAFRYGGVWGIVGAILPVYLTILLRGSLLQATGALTLTIVCILFVRAASIPGRRGSAPDVLGVRSVPLDRPGETFR
ncbi:hypothetical protein [Microbacterium sp.]|jgi:hypothetical protein|uniref:hypothetical protein n=1 Tax=Microbacterium sp. TaxID=51671 RepID=UPI0037CCAF01